MAVTQKINPYSVIILVLSLIGLILMLISDFAALYLPYYSEYRYSCLTCGYNTPLNLFAMIVVILLLFAQIVIALNDLLPKKFLRDVVTKLGLLLAGLTLLFTIISGVSFAIAYGEYEWWFETGFYAGAITGLINAVLFFLKAKTK